jgi:MFS family permease
MAVALTMTKVPIYITAAILAVIVAYFSDKVGKRSPFIIGCLLMMVVGFSMCIATDPKVHPKVVYGGVFLAACAIYPAFPGVIAWLSNNLSGSLKRSVGMALQIGVGNLGGVSDFSFLDIRHWTKLTTDYSGHGFQLLPSTRRTSLHPRAWTGARFHWRWSDCLRDPSCRIHGSKPQAGKRD